MSQGLQIAGFRITIDPLLPVVVLVIGWILANHYLPGGSFWVGGLASLLLTLSILFHELGHALSARRHHLTIERIHLFLFGGMAELRTRPMNPPQEAEVALAGPMASLVLGAIGLAMASVMPDPYGLPHRLVHFVGQMNVLLAVFNLFPIFPLDGGRALRALFWRFSGRYVAASRWIRHVSVAMVILLGIVAAHQVWSADGRGWFLYLVMVAYMGYTVAAGSRELLTVPDLSDLLINGRSHVDMAADRSILLPALDKDLALTGVRRPDEDPILDASVGRSIDVDRPDTYDPAIRFEADVVPVVQEGRFVGLADAGELRFWLLEWPRS